MNPRCFLKPAGAVLLLAGLCVLPSPARAATEVLTVPNGSFESPVTPFVSLLIDSWKRTPKPDWYVEEGGFQWGQLTGLFVNTAPGAADHLENIDGRQAAWLFAVPEAGLWQWVRTADGSAVARFEAGKRYRVTADLLGAGGNMKPGVTMEVALFHTNAPAAADPVVRLAVASNETLFPSRNRFGRFTGTSPVVSPGDPGVGQQIGIRVLSTATAENQGGYWDVDNVRVEVLETPSPRLATVVEGGEMRVTWASEAGWRYRLRRSADLVNWVELAEERVGTGGTLSAALPVDPAAPGFVTVRVFPLD